MDKQEEFIERNIKAELIKQGFTPESSAAAAREALAKYRNGCNWKMGKVFETLLKEAKKTAKKPTKERRK